jgi:hypothetical protein
VGTFFATGPLHSDGTRVYFGARSAGPTQVFTPWVSDGTTAGTYSLGDLGSPGQSRLLFWDFHGITVFHSSNSALDAKLWRTNGTSAGTDVIGDVGVVSTSIYPVTHQAAGRSFFYVADNDGSGAELFAVDNENPIAVDDAPGSVQAGQALVIEVLANDRDLDGVIIPASVTVVAQPAHGGVSVSNTGIVTYTGNQAFTGADQFTYSVADNQGNRSMAATVRVTVTAATPPISPPAPPVSPPASPAPPSSGGGGGGAFGLVELLALLSLAMRSIASNGVRTSS